MHSLSINIERAEQANKTFIYFSYFSGPESEGNRKLEKADQAKSICKKESCFYENKGFYCIF